MDRPLIEVGELPCAEDFLGLAKETLFGLAYLAQATIGNNTGVNGFGISPTGPATLSFNIGAGSIYAIETADAIAYGVLGTDSTSIFKQGILPVPVTLTVTPPATSGFSQVYLVQVAYSDVDGGAALVPFFNSLDPTHPSSSTQNTVRFGQAVIELKAGTAAATGSQTTPSPDAGFTGLWAVTVANGATTVTSANWVQQSAGPFSTPWFPSLENLTSGAAFSPGTENVVSITGTGSHNYTPTAGAKALLIQVQAPGGGGGSTSAPSTGQASIGLAGGGGSYSQKYVLTSALTFPATVIIGAPGSAGGSGTGGGSGGTTSFVCTGMTSVVCTGGNGGTHGGVSTTFPGPSAGTGGGVASGGDVNINGGAAQSALFFNSTQIITGQSGNSQLGTPALQVGVAANGASGTGFGSGGGGGCAPGPSSAFNGAAGSPGIVIISELF